MAPGGRRALKFTLSLSSVITRDRLRRVASTLDGGKSVIYALAHSHLETFALTVQSGFKRPRVAREGLDQAAPRVLPPVCRLAPRSRLSLQVP